MTDLRNIIDLVTEHALIADVSVGDKVVVKTAKINRKGIVAYLSHHKDIVSIKFPGETGVETFYADEVHLLREAVLDVVARDKIFPRYRYFHKIKGQIVKISSDPVGKGNWKRTNNIVGTEDEFVKDVKSGKIRNVNFTRPLGKEKEMMEERVENITEMDKSEIEELNDMCKNLLSIDSKFADYLLERGIGPEQYGDITNNVYKHFLLRMKDDIRKKYRKCE
jgi:hypothetical protein